MIFSSLDYTHISMSGLVVFMAAYFIGIKFPDWDFKLKLRHRNILTHSPLILVFFMWIYRKNPSTEFRYFIMGFALSIGVHLIFDIFPKGWGGGARLQTPFVKHSFSAGTSKVMFFIFILTSIGIGIRYTSAIEEVIFLLLYGVGCILLNTVKEEKLMRPMSLYVVLLVATASIKYIEVREFSYLVYSNIQKTLINLL